MFALFWFGFYETLVLAFCLVVVILAGIEPAGRYGKVVRGVARGIVFVLCIGLGIAYFSTKKNIEETKRAAEVRKSQRQEAENREGLMILRAEGDQEPPLVTSVLLVVARCRSIQSPISGWSQRQVEKLQDDRLLRLIGDPGDDWVKLCLRAVILLDQGKWKDAELLLGKADEIASQYAKNKDDKARKLHAEFERAAREFRKAAGLPPASAEPHQLPWFSSMDADLDREVSRLKRAAAGSPNDETAGRGLLFKLLKLGDEHLIPGMGKGWASPRAFYDAALEQGAKLASKDPKARKHMVARLVMMCFYDEPGDNWDESHTYQRSVGWLTYGLRVAKAHNRLEAGGAVDQSEWDIPVTLLKR